MYRYIYHTWILWDRYQKKIAIFLLFRSPPFSKKPIILGYILQPLVDSRDVNPGSAGSDLRLRVGAIEVVVGAIEVSQKVGLRYKRRP